MIIQEIKATYYSEYEEIVTTYFYTDVPVTEEKVERYCSKLFPHYKELVSVEPLFSYKLNLDEQLIELINRTPTRFLEPYNPFMELSEYAKKMQSNK